MKLLLVTFCLLLFCKVSGQSTDRHSSHFTLREKKNIAAQMPAQNDTMPNAWPPYSRFRNQPEAFNLTKKSPGVYSLRQDNMPCIVPDTKDVTEIPNLWRAAAGLPFKATIPNPAQPRSETELNK